MNTNVPWNDSDGYLTARRLLAVLGVLFATAAISLVIGPVGLVIAVGVGAAQYFVSGPVAFATGQIALIALYPSEGPLALFIASEIGLSCLLLSGAFDHNETLRMVIATVIAGIVLGGSTWFGLRSTNGIWVGGIVAVTSTAIIGYGLHRYERVRLNLVEPNE